MSGRSIFKSSIQIGGEISSSLKSSFGLLRSEYDKISDEVSNLKNKQKNLNKEISSAKRAGQSIDKLQNQYGKLEQGIMDATNEQKELHAHIKRNEAAGRPIVRLQNRYDRLSREITDAKEKQNSLTASIAQARGSVTTINRLEQEYKQLGDQIDRASSKKRKFASIEARRKDRAQARDDARSDVFDKGALAFAAVQPIKVAIEFESVMADLNKVANFTAGEYAEAQIEILKMSSVMPMAAEEITSIMTAAAQSNIAKDQLKDFADAAIKMGVAFDLSGSKTGEMMAGWRAGMNLTQKEVLTLADTMNALSNTSNAKAGDIAAVVTRMGAVAKTAGLTTTEIAGLSAALLNSGTAPEVAGTALKNFTNSLTKGEAATKAQIEAYRKLGFSQKQLAKDMQQDARGTMSKVLEALSKAPKHAQSALISSLFGEEAKGAIAPLLVNLNSFNDIMDKAADKTGNAGSMLAEYQVRSKTTANALTIFGNNAKRLGIAMGTPLLKPITKIVNGISALTITISEFAERNPVIVEAVAMFTTVLIGLGVAMAVVKFGALALMAINPFSWVVAAIAFVGTLVVAVIDNWGAITEYTNKLVTSMSTSFSRP